jgi:predicted DNA-binding transcriptional regulator AlpA
VSPPSSAAPLSLELTPQQLKTIAKLAAEFVEPPAEEPWLSKPQLAETLGCSVRWIEDRLREGMPSVMLAGARKFRRSEVEGWLDAAGHLRRDGRGR